MVPYTILTLTLELDATRADRAKAAVKASFLDAQESSKYAQMAGALPMLHFMSVMLFEDDHFDPLLTIEVNFDGAADAFLERLAAEYDGALREIVRCSKRPRGDAGALYDAVTAAGSAGALDRYLALQAVTPVTPYRGARGFSRARILAEAKLYDEAQEALGGGEAYVGRSAGDVHRALRAEPRIAALLEGPAPDPLPWRPTRGDWARLWLAILGLYVGLGLPGLVAAWFLDPFVVLAALVVAVGGIVLNSAELRALVLSAGQPSGAIGTKPALIGLGAVGAMMLVGGLHWRGALPGPAAIPDGFWWSVTGYAAWLLSGLLAALLALGLVLGLLRRLERNDPIHDPAVLSDKALKAMAEMAGREDRIGQNHMGSLLIVKPGLLRTILLRVGHFLLARLARTVFADGFLGPMRTIHFAHWCILNNGARLIFFSNFDGSWDSYLSDFTEKASAGVNLAWANCIGFPEAAFLIFGGSQNGRQFKAWARHSMAPTLFWFSAYRDVSVNEIHRNARVAAGLRQATLSDPAEWARDL